MTVAIRAARVFDVEAGTLRADQVVLVDGERIADVRDAALPLPDGALVVDLPGHVLLPGLIDLHTHLVGDIEGGHYTAILARSEADEALTGAANARATLRAGFTTVRDVGTFRAFVDVALRRAIEAGHVPGPRMMCAGAYVTCTSGGGTLSGLAPDVVLPRQMRIGVADTPDEVRRAVRELVNGGADLIKVIATGAVLAPGTHPGAPELTEEQIRAAVEEAAGHGVHVAAHAHGAEGAKRATRAGVRSIEHGSLLDDEALDLMAEHGTYLVADIFNGDWINEQGTRESWPAETMQKNADTTDTQRAAFTKAVARGVRIGYGTDAGVYPHGMNARQFGYQIRYGLTPMQAIRSATVWAAECMGWSGRVGVIRPGAYADLIAVQGNPLEDITGLENTGWVMKGGAVVRD